MSVGHSFDHLPEEDGVIEDIIASVESGITTLDFGDIYLGVEEKIGAALRKLQDKIGVRARDCVQLHTKYVPDLSSLHCHAYADAERIIHRSLARLGVERLDLVQFHWWDYAVPGYIEALRDLVKLQREGYIRLIGVTNFDVARMREFVEAGITPATAQVQYSVLDRRPEHGLIDFCTEHGIQLLCYGTVAGGFISERYLDVPEPQPPFSNRSLMKYKLIIDEFGGWDVFQELLHCLQGIAGKHGCSIGSAASAYTLAKPEVAAVIVGAKDSSHLAENLRAAQLRLDLEDIAAIDRQCLQSLGPKGDVYELERNDPKHSNIMHKHNNAK